MINHNDHHTEHNAEDHTVYYRVGLFFLAVLAVIVLLSIAN
ncbi:hypothetical protein [Desulfofustis glycolicus]|uniref:Uncharacterized protein n=1 Tax=Desulfofustis glycolicus DSM 9705 TaxID=1121409 RepID=A0A1M5WJJ6_9BACT|nr:hypothetical protein [Desulfofustis glycolicus]SHH87621.1 hypothetical protein SAMN02745124_02335 [Desulfofustis glycolicus DSM 9705]